MCLLWKQRQKKLGLDDFGNKLSAIANRHEQTALIDDQDE